MSCGTFQVTKDPEADLDYRFDWSAWLDTDTIVTSTWAAQAGSGFTLHDDSIEDNTETIVWISGGVVADSRWGVTNTIVTAAGRTEERTLMIKVEER